MAQGAIRIFSLTRAERYGIAVLSVVIAAAFRLALHPLIGDDAPLLFFYFAVILSAWCGGLWPGLLATALSLLLGDYLFLAPRHSIFHYENDLDLSRAIFVGFFGMVYSLLADRLRNSIKAELECAERLNLMMTRDITERKLANEALREGQQFMRHIVEVSPSVIYIYDVEQRKNVFVNRGIVDALGYQPEDAVMGEAEFLRSVMHPDDWRPFLAYLGRFAGLRDDETIEFEYRMRHSSGDWRWYHSRDKVFARNEDGSVREIIGTATDITERKWAEEKSSFIVALNQTLRPLAGPGEIMAAAARMLGEHLGADRCAYAEVEADEEYLTITSDHTRGDTPSIVGRFSVDDLGSEALRLMRVNRPYVINDIETETPEGTDLSAFRRAEIQALVCVPLSKEGRFVARMSVQQKTPRRWLDKEVKLITIVANRCWESVARAKAVRDLRESEERYRAFIKHSSEAIWRFELEQPIPVTLPEDEQIEMLYRYAYLAECNDAMARMYGYESADQIVGARIGDLLVKSDPANIAHLRALRRSGYNLTDSESHEVDREGNTKYFLNNLTGIEKNGAIVRAWGTQRDITEQKRAEVARRESEERYRLLTELSPNGVVIVGPDGTVHLANQSMLQMLDSAPERVVGRNLFDFLDPEYLDHCRNCLGALMTENLLATQVEAAFLREDGRVVPVEVNGVRFDWMGQPFAQIVIHDITGRKQAEVERERLLGEIEAERDQLRQILEQMPIGVSIAEAPSGRPLFHNREAERLIGHPLLHSDDYKGYAQYGALREDGSPYRPEEYPSARTLISGEVIKGEEMKYRRGDGTETWLSVDSAPIHDADGRMVLAVAAFVDIAERKQAEESLRESEERFAKAFRISPDALVISRLSDGVVIEANDRFVSLSGYDRDEVIGKSTIDLGLYVNPMDRQRMVAILKEQNCVRDFEFEMKRKSGEARLVMFSAEPLELRGERCWLTIARDITERKQAEEALRESEEQARRQLAYVEAIYATAPVGLCFVDSDLRYLSINERLAEIDGKSVEEHLGHTLREVVPEIAGMIEPYYRRVIETGEPVLNVEISMTPEPGVVRHFI
ncbi:MAG: PAS domain S-box protein, partial [Blastocatellia bacterium]